MLGANATVRTPADPPSNPMIIQGRRIPSREEVRSLNSPKNGLPTMAIREPIPVTSPRLLGGCSMRTRVLIFRANVTSRGARKTTLVPTCATAYSEMKPQPTRCGADSDLPVPSPGPRTLGICAPP
jgi:hypothetical protein